EVAFVIVTSPATLAIDEAIYFSERLAEQGMRRDAFVINQMHPLIAEPSGTSAQLELEARAILPEGADAGRLIARMRRALDDARASAVSDRIQADRLENLGSSKSTVYVEVPLLEHDVHDLRSLAVVASYLSGSSVHEHVVR